MEKSSQETENAEMFKKNNTKKCDNLKESRQLKNGALGSKT